MGNEITGTSKVELVEHAQRNPGAALHPLIISSAMEQRNISGVVANTLGRQVNAYPQLASAALVTTFLAAMLVTANLFIEYRSMKISTVGVIQVKGLPL